jgi:peroxiredoxin
MWKGFCIWWFLYSALIRIIILVNMLRNIVLSPLYSVSLLAAISTLGFFAKPVSAWSAGESISPLQPSEVVPDFSLLDHQGRMRTLSRQSDSKAVALFVQGNGCPIVRQSVEKLKSLQSEFGPQGVVFAMLNANTQDTVSEIRQEAEEYGVNIPILKDDTQWVARTLGLRRTAEILLIEAGSWKLMFRGGIDDQLIYGGRKTEASREFFKDAVTQLLAGSEIKSPVAPFKGCKIFYDSPKVDATGEISYSETIAPILLKNCFGCHQPGQIGPFSMSRYTKVRGWSEMIREVVLTKRMPPWHADPHYGEFSNDRSLTIQEKQQLLAWIDADCPRGEGDDPLEVAFNNLQSQKESGASESQWKLGEPDHVLSLKKPMYIPANGVFPYMYEKLVSPVEEDVWLRGVEILPGNRSVLHHCLVFIRYPKNSGYKKDDDEGGVKGCFAGYVPGYEPGFYPLNSGKFVPKGSTFIIQMHYTATGKEEVDDTRIGLYLADSTPQYEFKTKSAFDTEFKIPAGSSNHITSGTYRFENDAILHDLNPHMHYRGSWFRYVLALPDGTESTLLSTPNYDFNWQTTYRLKNPLNIPAGSVLRCEGAFDNSAQNPFNPDPTKTVGFGEQTYDEMFIGYFSFAEKNGIVAQQKKLSESALESE